MTGTRQEAKGWGLRLWILTERGERKRVDFIVQLVLSDEGFIDYTMKGHA